MKKKKNDSTAVAVNAGVMLLAAMVIVSMFMFYVEVKAGSVVIKSWSGWNILGGAGDGAATTFTVLSLILAAAVAGLALLRVLGLFRGKLFTMLFALAGVALLVVSVILFVVVARYTIFGYTGEFSRGIGVILNLVFSILAGLITLGALVCSRK